MFREVGPPRRGHSEAQAIYGSNSPSLTPWPKPWHPLDPNLLLAMERSPHHLPHHPPPLSPSFPVKGPSPGQVVRLPNDVPPHGVGKVDLSKASPLQSFPGGYTYSPQVSNTSFILPPQPMISPPYPVSDNDHPHIHHQDHHQNRYSPHILPPPVLPRSLTEVDQRSKRHFDETTPDPTDQILPDRRLAFLPTIGAGGKRPWNQQGQTKGQQPFYEKKVPNRIRDEPTGATKLKEALGEVDVALWSGTTNEQVSTAPVDQPALVGRSKGEEEREKEEEKEEDEEKFKLSRLLNRLGVVAKQESKVSFSAHDLALEASSGGKETSSFEDPQASITSERNAREQKVGSVKDPDSAKVSLGGQEQGGRKPPPESAALLTPNLNLNGPVGRLNLKIPFRMPSLSRKEKTKGIDKSDQGTRQNEPKYDPPTVPMPMEPRFDKEVEREFQFKGQTRADSENPEIDFGLFQLRFPKPSLDAAQHGGRSNDFKVDTRPIRQTTITRKPPPKWERGSDSDVAFEERRRVVSNSKQNSGVTEHHPPNRFVEMDDSDVNRCPPRNLTSRPAQGLVAPPSPQIVKNVVDSGANTNLGRDKLEGSDWGEVRRNAETKYNEWVMRSNELTVLKEHARGMPPSEERKGPIGTCERTLVSSSQESNLSPPSTFQLQEKLSRILDSEFCDGRFDRSPSVGVQGPRLVRRINSGEIGRGKSLPSISLEERSPARGKDGDVESARMDSTRSSLDLVGRLPLKTEPSGKVHSHRSEVSQEGRGSQVEPKDEAFGARARSRFKPLPATVESVKGDGTDEHPPECPPGRESCFALAAGGIGKGKGKEVASSSDGRVPSTQTWNKPIKDRIQEEKSNSGLGLSGIQSFPFPPPAALTHVLPQTSSKSMEERFQKSKLDPLELQAELENLISKNQSRPRSGNRSLAKFKAGKEEEEALFECQQAPIAVGRRSSERREKRKKKKKTAGLESRTDADLMVVEQGEVKGLSENILNGFPVDSKAPSGEKQPLASAFGLERGTSEDGSRKFRSSSRGEVVGSEPPRFESAAMEREKTVTVSESEEGKLFQRETLAQGEGSSFYELAMMGLVSIREDPSFQRPAKGEEEEEGAYTSSASRLTFGSLGPPSVVIKAGLLEPQRNEMRKLRSPTEVQDDLDELENVPAMDISSFRYLEKECDARSEESGNGTEIEVQDGDHQELLTCDDPVENFRRINSWRISVKPMNRSVYAGSSISLPASAITDSSSDQTGGLTSVSRSPLYNPGQESSSEQEDHVRESEGITRNEKRKPAANPFSETVGALTVGGPDGGRRIDPRLKAWVLKTPPKEGDVFRSSPLQEGRMEDIHPNSEISSGNAVKALEDPFLTSPQMFEEVAEVDLLPHPGKSEVVRGVRPLTRLSSEEETPLLEDSVPIITIKRPSAEHDEARRPLDIEPLDIEPNHLLAPVGDRNRRGGNKFLQEDPEPIFRSLAHFGTRNRWTLEENEAERIFGAIAPSILKGGPMDDVGEVGSMEAELGGRSPSSDFGTPPWTASNLNFENQPLLPSLLEDHSSISMSRGTINTGNSIGEGISHKSGSNASEQTERPVIVKAKVDDKLNRKENYVLSLLQKEEGKGSPNMEALIARYPNEIMRFIRLNPTLLLIVSLRAKLEGYVKGTQGRATSIPKAPEDLSQNDVRIQEITAEPLMEGPGEAASPEAKHGRGDFSKANGDDCYTRLPSPSDTTQPRMLTDPILEPSESWSRNEKAQQDLHLGSEAELFESMVEIPTLSDRIAFQEMEDLESSQDEKRNAKDNGSTGPSTKDLLIEKALHRIVDYVESAGELQSLQRRLISLHEKLLAATGQKSSMDARIASLEQAVFSQNPNHGRERGERGSR
ncbi:hypothetical protein IE53DRAFT_379566 [Violaceomyces palustris]|uniref:Uncharacterized protein n=1 Tax=Violaceomyces palustris TaxID=1673888 RepID=A0ACD0NXW4_9BASI|nr:hypothetical protein IE53DRAFT_379566 [Violaceomyces palustris]